MSGATVKVKSGHSLSRRVPVFTRSATASSPKASDVLDHATGEIVIGNKLGIDATKKFAGEGFSTRPHKWQDGTDLKRLRLAQLPRLQSRVPS